MNIVNKNDRHDLDPTEGKLIRIGHFLWKLYWQASGEPGLADALETVWAAKRLHRAELKTRREVSAQKFTAYWKQRKAA
jgi:hypothetical protein